jgi:hypothetical protein
MKEMKRRYFRTWLQVAGSSFSEVGGHVNKMYFATSKFMLGCLCHRRCQKTRLVDLFGDEKGFNIGISTFVCRTDGSACHKIDDHAASDDKASRRGGKVLCPLKAPPPVKRGGRGLPQCH